MMGVDNMAMMYEDLLHFGDARFSVKFDIFLIMLLFFICRDDGMAPGEMAGMDPMGRRRRARGLRSSPCRSSWVCSFFVQVC